MTSGGVKNMPAINAIKNTYGRAFASFLVSVKPAQTTSTVAIGTSKAMPNANTMVVIKSKVNNYTEYTLEIEIKVESNEVIKSLVTLKALNPLFLIPPKISKSYSPITWIGIFAGNSQVPI